MISRPDLPGGKIRRAGAIAMVVAFAWLALAGLESAAASSAPAPAVSQCVACHTDAAKLKALTPPDPPPTEEGEG